MRWMIYGANGYTGNLIAKHALSCGLKPILAGRNHQKVGALAQELGFDSRSFDLERESAEPFLKDCDLVLNCAGPFSKTVEPMVQACLKSRTSYLDITGEIDVFERIHGLTSNLKDAGIFAIPGIGFDVVPSDCLALKLKESLPSAKNLTLAFHPGRGGPSRGTAKTMIEHLPKGGAIRRAGKIVKVPPAYRQRNIPFGNGDSPAVTIPWGDVSTAFYSTGIPNIEVYMGASQEQIKQIKWMKVGRYLMKLPGMVGFAQRQIEKRPAGPSEKARDRGACYLFGEVSNGKETIQAGLKTPEGYKLTYLTAIAAIQEIIKSSPSPGAHTPSMAFGKDFIMKIPGVEEIQAP